jgi:hypothetical protein
VPEAFVLQTLRTARTKASPRGGFAGTSPVDLPPGSSLDAAGLASLMAESGRGEPREFGVSVDAFTDLCRGPGRSG